MHVARLSSALGIDSVYELLPTHGTRCQRSHMALTTADDKLEGAALEDWQAQQMVLYLKARGTIIVPGFYSRLTLLGHEGMEKYATDASGRLLLKGPPWRAACLCANAA